MSLAAHDVFSGVVGQASAVASLRAAVRRPVHAYLLVGPSGSGKLALARSLAAGLLCDEGGCGKCSVCRRSLAGIHPDLVVIERTGAAVSVDDARSVVRAAQRTPLEASRQVIVVPDVHLARLAAPVLLKTVEEPPASTVVVLLAESVPPELVTIASRCVRVDLVPVQDEEIVRHLVDRGVPETVAAQVARVSRGSVSRAVVLAEGGGVARRSELWSSVPHGLDGTGSTVAVLVEGLLASAEEAVEPLRARHRSEIEALDADEDAGRGRRPRGRKEIEERQHREERRWRTDDIQAGLNELASAYRSRLLSARTPSRRRQAVAAISEVEAAMSSLVRNPNERLLLESLLVRLARTSG